jgi:hypothetical protein
MPLNGRYGFHAHGRRGPIFRLAANAKDFP